MYNYIYNTKYKNKNNTKYLYVHKIKILNTKQQDNYNKNAIGEKLYGC